MHLRGFPAAGTTLHSGNTVVAGPLLPQRFLLPVDLRRDSEGREGRVITWPRPSILCCSSRWRSTGTDAPGARARLGPTSSPRGARWTKRPGMSGKRSSSTMRSAFARGSPSRFSRSRRPRLPPLARLPVVSGRKLARSLVRYGYEEVSQRVSHLKLRRSTAQGEHVITIPIHTEVARGTLNDILKAVASRSNTTRDSLVRELDL